jgi:hypothetical protein
MSLVFNAASTDFKGIVQTYEKEIGANRGDIANDVNKLKEFTADVNQAWDDYVYLALKSSGMWQWDDSNFTDYPIIKANLVSGQQDYTFTTDEGGHLILDIFKVMVLPSATATQYDEIFPIDQQQIEAYNLDDDIAEETNTSGVPERYDKTANGIFLDAKPNYNATNGLKVYINREPSYFVSTDTSKKPGCPGIHHRYFALKPALDYARRKSLANYNLIREEVVSFEGDEEKGITGSIERYFTRREKDVRPVFRPEPSIYE